MSNIRKIDVPSYANWIDSMDWTYFCTFTTRYELTLKSCRRLMERTHAKYAEYMGVNPVLFWVAEPYELKDGYHAHGLLHIPDEFTKQPHFDFLRDAYMIMAGSKVIQNDKGKLKFDTTHRVELQKFDRRRRAGLYATKYIMKSNSGVGDYDLII